ncbi:MAG: hypothetical protein R3C40_01635 [Parvularculaceae bacterium]
MQRQLFSARPGETVSLNKLTAYLAANGYSRASTVREPGEFAVRGGLVDLYPPGADEPLRLDFFGDTLESVRAFDPMTQLTTRQLGDVNLSAATEVLLTDETFATIQNRISRAVWRRQRDPVYEAVSAGRKQSGMEHWLPLYYEGASTIFLTFSPAACCSLNTLRMKLRLTASPPLKTIIRRAPTSLRHARRTMSFLRQPIVR